MRAISGFVLAAALLAVGLAGPARAGRVRTPLNLSPLRAIEAPAEGRLIVAGESLSFAGTAFDIEGDVPLTYHWEFGAGSGIPASTVEDPGAVTFATPGIYQVTFAATDSGGRTNPNPAEVTVVVQPAPVLIDNGEPGFSATAGWGTSGSPEGFVGPDYALVGSTPGETATWTFPVPSAGAYAISAQWVSPWFATEAAVYTIRQGGSDLATLRVDQRSAGGRPNLLGTFDLAAGSVEVVLHNESCCFFVLADAVWLSHTGFGVASPTYHSVWPTADVPIQMTTLGFPASWGTEFVLDGDEPGAAKVFGASPLALFEGVSLAEHSVAAHLIDEQGRRVPGVTTEVQFGAGDVWVAVGDSITDGTGDDDGSDDLSLDQRNRHPGYTPILNDLLTAELGRPQTLDVHATSGIQTLLGVTRVTEAAALFPLATRMLIQLGTNDCAQVQRPSGVGLLPGNPGYEDSYKDHLRQVIQAAVAAGKEPVLAKLPSLLDDPFHVHPVEELNALLEEYNDVIDELVLEEGLAVTPPDLYAHFTAFPEHFHDAVHPNGAGYQAIAALWLGALVP
jgi:lysophospholipase L1-like esterase/PKD repeat protein